MAFAVLVVIVVIRFGFKPSTPDAPAPSIVDAAIANAPIDAADVVPDAMPLPKTPKPIAKRPTTKIIPKPIVPTPVVPHAIPSRPVPVTPAPVGPQCVQPPNPAGCPATEPNINRPCDAEGARCVYGTSCCPPLYVCTDGAFEAWFSHCP